MKHHLSGFYLVKTLCPVILIDLVRDIVVFVRILYSGRSRTFRICASISGYARSSCGLDEEELASSCHAPPDPSSPVGIAAIDPQFYQSPSQEKLSPTVSNLFLRN